MMWRRDQRQWQGLRSEQQLRRQCEGRMQGAQQIMRRCCQQRQKGLREAAAAQGVRLKVRQQ